MHARKSTGASLLRRALLVRIDVTAALIGSLIQARFNGWDRVLLNMQKTQSARIISLTGLVAISLDDSGRGRTSRSPTTASWRAETTSNHTLSTMGTKKGPRGNPRNGQTAHDTMSRHEIGCKWARAIFLTSRFFFFFFYPTPPHVFFPHESLFFATASEFFRVLSHLFSRLSETSCIGKGDSFCSPFLRFKITR